MEGVKGAPTGSNWERPAGVDEWTEPTSATEL